MPAGHRVPDPLRAHGAQVYLILSILTGVLGSVRDGRWAALFAGGAFAGVFLVAAAFAVPDARARARRGLIGVLLLVGGPAGAWMQGAPTGWLVFAAAGVFPAALAGYYALRQGFLSAPALGFAVAALAVSAPATACAGGSTPRQALVLLLVLAPFFAWRTLRLRQRLADHALVGRRAVRRAGWGEALFSLTWTAMVVMGLHLLR